MSSQAVPSLLPDPDRPFMLLAASLGVADKVFEDLESVIVQETEIEPDHLSEETLGRLLEAVAVYGSALSGEIRFKPEEPPEDAIYQVKQDAERIRYIPLGPELRRDEVVDVFKDVTAGVRPKCHLELDKRGVARLVLEREGLPAPPRLHPVFVFAVDRLERLLRQTLRGLDTWWKEDVSTKLVILAPRWTSSLNGAYLAVLGGDPVERWRQMVSEEGIRERKIQRRKTAPDSELEAEVEPNDFLEARRDDLRWMERWVEHLTPLHLMVEGDTLPGDPAVQALHKNLANLCLLYTASSVEAVAHRGGPGAGQAAPSTEAWTAEYRGAGEQVTLRPAELDEVGDDDGCKGTKALARMVRWAYEPRFRSDRLDYFQSIVARFLRPAVPDNGKEVARPCRNLLLCAEMIDSRLDQDWKMFIKGRLEKFGEKVRALEEDVAKTVESFSSQIAAMVKSLSDTMLGAVTVLLGAFIATLIKQELRLEILTTAVAVYVVYLLAFPLLYNLRERWESYLALDRQFEARHQRYKKYLSEATVEDIVGDHVSRSKSRFYRWFWTILATYLIVAGVLWALVPSPIDAVAYEEPDGMSLEGVLEPDQALRTARPVAQDRLVGAEDVAVDAAGRLYTGTEDGRIVRVTRTPDDREILETLADTGGRPLGLHFGPAGKTLFVADAEKGLLAVDEAGGIKPLATGAGGVPFGFTDDLDVAPDGTIYFSDASSRFGVDEYLHDLLEARPHGRLLRYDPKAQDKVSVLLDGLYFANGVALASDQSFVLVNETYRYQIRRYWLKGPKAGASDLFVKDLPGFPDNLSRDPATGRFWVALYTVRNPALERLHPHPFLKNQLAKLPRFLWPKPEPYGLVLAIDEQGRIVESLHDPGGERVRTVTSVEPHGGKLYLGSLHGPIAVWEP